VPVGTGRGSSGARRLTPLLVVLAALLGAAALPSTSLAAGCTVVNSSTSQGYTNLQAAVNAATAGDTLTIAGSCAGETTVDRDLTLERATGAMGRPTLLGRVTMSEGVSVSFTQLKLAGGVYAPRGGTLQISGCALTGSVNGGESEVGRYLDLQMVDSRVTKAGIGMVGSASVAKSVITGNSGDGINVWGEIEVTSSTVSKNTGLGIKGHTGNIVLSGSKVVENGGGGIEDDRATVYLVDSKVTGNTSPERGGGVAVFQGTVQLAGTSSVSKNSTTGEGGGIWAFDYAKVILEGSASVKENTASAEGGGIYASGHTFVNVGDKASVKKNVTASHGAGIYAGIAYSEEEPTKVTLGGSSVVSGNKAAEGGGGVYLRAGGSILELLDSASIRMNEAGTNGGGVFIGKNEYGAGTLIYGAGWSGVIGGNVPDDVFAQ
jgi:predicted outer membrane repeat protein